MSEPLSRRIRDGISLIIVAGALITTLVLAGRMLVATTATGDVDTCYKVLGEAKIAACSRVIASGRYSGTNLADFYNDRGTGWHEKGDNDRALADYDRAARLGLTWGGLNFNRGEALRAKGDIDHAIAEYDHAIRLDPKFRLPYYARGLAKRRKGDIAGADRDFATAKKLGVDLVAANKSWRTPGVVIWPAH